jgi:hypothetical protein
MATQGPKSSARKFKLTHYPKFYLISPDLLSLEEVREYQLYCKPSLAGRLAFPGMA